MSEHTPGPWKVIPPRIGASITVYDPKERPIATTCSNTSPETMKMHRSGEVKANARLIAAAPDLYASLLEMVASTEEMQGTTRRAEEHNARLARARAAIATAASETPHEDAPAR